MYLKYEGLNPTGSFKDRGMTVAMSKALERGAKAVICASTGNTSASAAAYAARAGIRAFVLIPEGKIALGKLAQAMFHGAQVLQIHGNFDDALRLVREVSEKHPVVLVNSVNPDRIEGQKTGAFEICEQLDGPPSYQFMPVGNAGNITAYWRGYREYRAAGKIAQTAADDRMAGRGRGPHRAGARRREARDDRLRHPDREPGELAGGDGRAPAVRRRDRHGLGRADPRGLRPAGATGRGLLRAGLGGLRGRAGEVGEDQTASRPATGWSASSPATG